MYPTFALPWPGVILSSQFRTTPMILSDRTMHRCVIFSQMKSGRRALFVLQHHFMRRLQLTVCVQLLTVSEANNCQANTPVLRGITTAPIYLPRLMATTTYTSM